MTPNDSAETRVTGTGGAPTILAIDTTSEFGGVALRAGGKLIAERRMHAPDGFSQVLFFEIQQLFAQSAPIGVREVDCFASAAGPGSFTGVRVGLAAAKGLAEANRKPIAAVSNLRALATFGTRARRMVLLDARRGEVYAAVYDEHLNCVSPEIVMALPRWLETVAAALGEADSGEAEGDHGLEFVTFAGAPFRMALSGTRWAKAPWVEAPRGLAAAIGFCAEADYEAGRTGDPALADANYVRRSDAELFWKG